MSRHIGIQFDGEAHPAHVSLLPDIGNDQVGWEIRHFLSRFSVRPVAKFMKETLKWRQMSRRDSIIHFISTVSAGAPCSYLRSKKEAAANGVAGVELESMPQEQHCSSSFLIGLLLLPHIVCSSTDMRTTSLLTLRRLMHHIGMNGMSFQLPEHECIQVVDGKLRVLPPSLSTFFWQTVLKAWNSLARDRPFMGQFEASALDLSSLLGVLAWMRIEMVLEPLVCTTITLMFEEVFHTMESVAREQLSDGSSPSLQDLVRSQLVSETGKRRRLDSAVFSVLGQKTNVHRVPPAPLLNPYVAHSFCHKCLQVWVYLPRHICLQVWVYLCLATCSCTWHRLC